MPRAVEPCRPLTSGSMFTRVVEPCRPLTSGSMFPLLVPWSPADPSLPVRCFLYSCRGALQTPHFRFDVSSTRAVEPCRPLTSGSMFTRAVQTPHFRFDVSSTRAVEPCRPLTSGSMFPLLHLVVSKDLSGFKEYVSSIQ
ncbi:hypothetical protein P7K49_012567 [Saguinus oedipus]|uniref:Uncharacterized protein n=1 Tax=Saguinus oedipus TaxID=9490 RepID=A0ABQ9VTW9_SAGOE|nr:hypothetical protein P7K49_012567 [Saguinus oedipus]